MPFESEELERNVFYGTRGLTNLAHFEALPRLADVNSQLPDAREIVAQSMARACSGTDLFPLGRFAVSELTGTKAMPQWGVDGCISTFDSWTASECRVHIRRGVTHHARPGSR